MGTFVLALLFWGYLLPWIHKCFLADAQVRDSGTCNDQVFIGAGDMVSHGGGDDEYE